MQIDGTIHKEQTVHRDVFRVFIVVSVVCFVLAGAAPPKKAIAQLDQSLILELFTNADGSPCKMPCLFGIRPGETTIGEAKALIQAHPLTHSLQQLSVDEVAHMHRVYHPEM